MRVGLCAVVLVVGCSVPATTVVYPGGPVISTPSETPIECPAETQPRREKKPSKGSLKAAREWCELPDGSRHGPYRDYDGRSTIRERGTYERGKKVGVWITVGKFQPFLVESIEYKNGLRDGPTWAITTCSQRTGAFWGYDRCSVERTPVAEGTYRADQRHGRFTFYAGGRIVMSAELVDGKRHGEMLLYRLPGKGDSTLIRRGRWERDQPAGTWTELRRDGLVEAEGEYVLTGDLLEGKWPEEFGHTGNDSMVSKYFGGLATHGVWTKYDFRGGKETGPYERRVRHGRWTSWYPGGALHKKLGYDGGKLTGSYEEWSASGTLVAKGAYLEGRKHGDWKEFHANGKLAAAGRYAKGQKVGVWVEMSETGQVLSRDNFIDGIKQGD